MEAPVSITLDQLKEIAKAAVAKSDRVKVKEVISKFGTKLAEIDARLYDEVATALKAL